MALLDFLPSPREVMHPHLDPLVWPHGAHHDARGRLVISGVALTDIADEYGTPTYVIDEIDVSRRADAYREALPDTRITYPGNAALVRGIAGWAKAEGMAIDIGSAGELAAAVAAGVDPTRMILHGSSPTPGELRAALSAGVGRMVVASNDEITRLAGLLDRRQTVLVGIVADVDLFGRPVADVDSKSGFRISNGRADRAVARVVSQHRFDMIGLYCDVRATTADVQHWRTAAGCLVAQMNQVLEQHGVLLSELHFGAGHATPSAQAPNLRELAEAVDDVIDNSCAEFRLPRPGIVLEPGRAVVAPSGVTLFRVAGVSRTPGGRSVVSITARMTANLRQTLQSAKHAVVLANRYSHGRLEQVTVTGIQRAARDEVATGMQLPSDVRAGDLLAVACTNAYDEVGRAHVVAVCDGYTRILARLDLGEI
ncbi:diaminopimelate decarboxylase family protein [Rhodococcus sp. NPDC127528]|uniref:diaminopimelate decarboxylase family protein n=1 Tax=unclassified Rhodococcus (in: high G+C Gram-positive bacteria) TaxID=192944 RepID=UPI00363855C5